MESDSSPGQDCQLNKSDAIPMFKDSSKTFSGTYPAGTVAGAWMT
jgi:hypothetical protein